MSEILSLRETILLLKALKKCKLKKSSTHEKVTTCAKISTQNKLSENTTESINKYVQFKETSNERTHSHKKEEKEKIKNNFVNNLDDIMQNESQITYLPN